MKVLSAKDFWLIGAPLLSGLGTCYLIGYWGALGINFLEFVGLADLGKLAIYNLFPAVVFFVAGFCLSAFTSPRLPPGGGAQTTFGRFGRRHGRLLLALNLIAMTCLALFGHEPEKWFLIASLLVFFGPVLTHRESIIEAMPDPRVRSTVMAMLVLLPAFSFAYGRMDAYLALQPGSATTVEVIRSGVANLTESGAKVLYLGLLGDTYVLRESDTARTILMQRRPEVPLVLNPKRPR